MYMARHLLVVILAVVCFIPAVAQDEAETELDTSTELASIKRICVEKFAGLEPQADQAREMAIASLFGTKKFRVTENCEKAEAILRGSVTGSSEQRVRVEGDSVEFGRAVGYSSASVGGGSGSGSAGFGAAKGADAETLASSETISQASITLRIVDPDGEILWAHTEEAKAGKVKGPVAFAIDRAIDQLLRDIEKAKKEDRNQPHQ